MNLDAFAAMLNDYRLSMHSRLAAAALSVTCCLLGASHATETVLGGSATVIDGDTLEIEGERIRLYGLHAPALAQSCTSDGADWPCGERAAEALRSMVATADGTLACDLLDSSDDNLPPAICKVGATLVNKTMVETGWALAEGGPDGALYNDETHAIEHQLGIWKGGFIPNDTWRSFAGIDGSEHEFTECSSCELRHRSLSEHAQQVAEDATSASD